MLYSPFTSAVMTCGSTPLISYPLDLGYTDVVIHDANCLGDVDFGPLTILCRPPTLIPRPETAHIFTRLAETIRAQRPTPTLRIADLCTGTGCIPLLLRHLLGPGALLTGFDLSSEAIALAKENARVLDLDAGFHELDVFHPSAAEQVVQHSGGRIGVLVSNPPYIPLHEYHALPASVRSYEDSRALLGDPSGGEGDGLAFYRRIADLLPDVLRSEEEMERDGLGGLPRVAVEIGAEQGKAVEQILRSGPGGVVRRMEVWVDQYGRDRAVVGWAS